MPKCPICDEAISWRERFDLGRNLIGDHFREAHQDYAFEYFALMVPLNFFSIGVLLNAFIVSLHVFGVITLRPISYAQFLLYLVIVLEVGVLFLRRRLQNKYKRNARARNQ